MALAKSDHEKPAVAQRKQKGEFPPLVQATRDWAQAGGSGEGSTEIKQISDAVTPSFESPYVEMKIKGRIDPSIDADIALLEADAVVDGELDLSGIGLNAPDMGTAFVACKQINSYAINGKAREELVSVLTATGSRMVSRMRGMFRRGNSYEGGGFNDSGG